MAPRHCCELLRRVLDPDPARQAVLRDAVRRALRVLEPAEEDRRVRLLQRLRAEPAAVEVGELAVVLEQVVRPDALHDLDRLAHVLCAAWGRCARRSRPRTPRASSPTPTPTLTLPFERWSTVAISAARTPGARYGVSVMLMPIRTFVVFAASQGISGQPWNHSPREDTGNAFGNSSIMPNEYWSSWRSEASGTTIRSSVQTESKSSSSARLVRSSSSLTVTLSRKFGRYRASFMRRPPHRSSWSTGHVRSSPRSSTCLRASNVTGRAPVRSQLASRRRSASARSWSRSSRLTTLP